MPMFKKTVKNILLISIIIAVGQIQIGGKTIGKFFIEGVGSGFVWTGNQALTTKWLGSMDHPEWLDTLFEVKSKAASKENKPVLNLDHLSEKDREQIKKILQ